MRTNVMEYKIDVASEFSMFPFGRKTPRDGDFTGEVFRDTLLKKYLIASTDEDKIVVDFTGVIVGIGSSFLSEAFGGSVEKGYISKQDFLKRLVITSHDDLYEKAITKYISEAEELKV